MALERKDAKPKFDPDAHERLKFISEFDGMGINEWIEQTVLREIARRYQAARKESSLADELERLGISGNFGAGQGKP